MKHARYGWLAKSYAAVTMLTIALLAGCAHDPGDAEVYRAVASDLETGGTAYGVLGESGSFFKLIDDRIIRLDALISEAELDAAEQDRVRHKLAVFKLFWHLAGLDKVRGFGWSSVRHRDGVFSNRIKLEQQKDSATFLDRVFSGDGEKFSELLHSLPRETIMAAGGRFSASAVLELLRSFGENGETLLTLLPHGFPVDAPENVNGWFLIAFARDIALPGSENCLMIQLPDRDGKLFKLIKNLFGGKIADDPGSGQMLLPFRDPENGWHEPNLMHKNGRLYIFNSLMAAKLFTGCPGGHLDEDELLVRYSADMPLDEAVLFKFFRRVKDSGVMLLDIPVSGVRMPMENRNSFGILVPRKSGWLYREHSEIDLTGEAGEWLIFPHLAEKFFPVPRPKKVPANGPQAKSAVKSDCQGGLKKLYPALLKYAEIHQNRFPAFEDRKNLEQLLLNYRKPGNIFYFGGEKGKRLLPVAVELHPPGMKSFCVLYADGRIKTYKLERSGSCRRIISFLYTVHRWDAGVFQQLIGRAAQLDDESEIKE